MKKYIYIGSENSHETVVDQNGNKYIVPYPIPDNWKVGEEVSIKTQHQIRHAKAGRYLDSPYWIDCSEDVFNTTTLLKRVVAKPEQDLSHKPNAFGLMPLDEIEMLEKHQKPDEGVKKEERCNHSHITLKIDGYYYCDHCNQKLIMTDYA